MPRSSSRVQINWPRNFSLTSKTWQNLVMLFIKSIRQNRPKGRIAPQSALITSIGVKFKQTQSKVQKDSDKLKIVKSGIFQVNYLNIGKS